MKGNYNNRDQSYLRYTGSFENEIKDRTFDNDIREFSWMERRVKNEFNAILGTARNILFLTLAGSIIGGGVYYLMNHP